ncbi:1,4-alpha-glucan branching protein GlgB [Anaerorhabdus sp.]|uniref:1,4-alpha-glucan branching protein GlgB n=2 Tax=Anaerorhabdus sp. TaxID=1872524 RepID=UPI002FC87A63
MTYTTIIESFHQGHAIDSYKLFGAHFAYEAKEGVRFTVYAPNAKEVQIIGGFNGWDGENHLMERTTDTGVWSLFIPGLKEWETYKYRITSWDGKILDKSDPYAFYSETRPQTASKIVNLDEIVWKDQKWMKQRTKNIDKPMNIYEVHAGSWKRYEDGQWFNYLELEKQLIPYVKEKGFTHIELMPLGEHPFDGSWGYQAIGYFSCTSRYGNPKEFAHFVDACHRNGIGVIMDMVPVHFVKDSHGLREFDGKPVYEYKNPSDANSQWGTCNFDLWSEEVRSFLISSAGFWCDVYHIDGIRIDAVANMIFWEGNKDRGTNDGALTFMRRMNYYLNKEYPSVMIIAEDSSDYPKVTQSPLDSGLGFDYKWDLGWMNDTLSYYAKDPIYRKYHHNNLSFSMAYFYSEKFILPLSHDEVVHGKKTIVDRMWGDYDQKFSQVRNLYIYMMTHPGKKLSFMGNELGMFREFDESRECDWFLLNYPRHDSFLRFYEDLNKIYLHHECLSKNDYDNKSFKWIDADNADQSIYSFYRESKDEILVTILNMTPVALEEFKLGVPYKGTYTELINSERDIYDGCNMCNFKPIRSKKDKMNNLENSIHVRLAPFGGIILRFDKTTLKETKKPVKPTRTKETKNVHK